MNEEISKPRETPKANKPIIKNLEVSIVQRGKFVGINGINLKKIYSKTGENLVLYLFKVGQIIFISSSSRCYNKSNRR